MPTQYMELTGTAKWAKVYKPDEAFGTSFWKIDVSLTPESQEIFNKSGLRLRPKKVDDKDYYTFRRPTSKVFKGKLEEFKPPIVIDSNNQPTTQLIGNGSEVTIKVEVYDSAMGKGHRLTGLRVNKLVEYVPPTRTDGNDSKSVNGLPF